MKLPPPPPLQPAAPSYCEVNQDSSGYCKELQRKCTCTESTLGCARWRREDHDLLCRRAESRLVRRAICTLRNYSILRTYYLYSLYPELWVRPASALDPERGSRTVREESRGATNVPYKSKKKDRREKQKEKISAHKKSARQGIL